MKHVVIIVFALLFSSCTTTQMRAFIHWDANVKDYQWLPSREIEKGGKVRTFEKALYAESNEDWEKLLPWNIEITPYKIRGEWI